MKISHLLIKSTHYSKHTKQTQHTKTNLQPILNMGCLVYYAIPTNAY